MMMRCMVLKAATTVLLVNALCAHSFVEEFQRSALRRNPSSLNGSHPSSAEQPLFPPLDLNLLAFPASDTLFPGQSTCVTLKEGRFFDLVDDATSNHNSMIGMVLMNDDGMFMDGMPLCKIVDVEVRSGFRGKVTMSVEFQAVGRARLEELKQMQPTIFGTCIEFQDNLQTNIEDLKNSQTLAGQLAENLKNPSSLVTYQRAYTDALAMLEDSYPEKESQDLAAKSWALMASLSPESVKRYGPKAIASNGIQERLDIISKALLEEQIQTAENMLSINTDDQEITGFK